MRTKRFASWQAPEAERLEPGMNVRRSLHPAAVSSGGEQERAPFRVRPTPLG